MRIVQIIDTLRIGGAQKMQVFLARSLQPLGIEITVVNLSRYAVPALVEQLETAGVRVVAFPFPRLFSPVQLFRLIMFLRREKFDLIHAYLTYSNIIGSLAGRLSGIPVIVSLRNSHIPKGKRSYKWRMEDFSLQHLADYVMANGEAVGIFARTRSGKTPVEVVANAVDLIPPLSDVDRNALRHELVGDDQRPMILSVGRLTKQKGFYDLLDAFKIIHSKHPNSVLVIAGGGDLKSGLIQRRHELELDKNVFLLGSRHDVPRLLGAADIYVNSSLWEGTPVSVLEAMAAGLPVVATTVGENPFLLSQETGILVPQSQPQELASAVISLLDSRQKRTELGLAARARVKKDYGREVWSRNILSLYAKFLPEANEYIAKYDESVARFAG